MSMRFWLDDDVIKSFSADMTSETGFLASEFDLLPGNPPYYVDYVRLFDVHYFSFND